MEDAQIRAIDPLQQLSIFDDRGPSATSIVGHAPPTSIAEPEDTHGLHELSQRNEYEPPASSRDRRPIGTSICVCFERLDDT
jgi:hypothetical protein